MRTWAKRAGLMLCALILLFIVWIAASFAFDDGTRGTVSENGCCMESVSVLDGCISSVSPMSDIWYKIWLDRDDMPVYIRDNDFYENYSVGDVLFFREYDKSYSVKYFMLYYAFQPDFWCVYFDADRSRPYIRTGVGLDPSKFSSG